MNQPVVEVTADAKDAEAWVNEALGSAPGTTLEENEPLWRMLSPEAQAEMRALYDDYRRRVLEKLAGHIVREMVSLLVQNPPLRWDGCWGPGT